MSQTTDAPDLVTFSKLPQLSDAIPTYPQWGNHEDEGKRYWATRFGEGTWGVAMLPTQKHELLGGPAILERNPFATLVRITENGWQWVDPIQEQTDVTEEEACMIAEGYRADLESLLMERALS